MEYFEMNYFNQKNRMFSKSAELTLIEDTFGFVKRNCFVSNLKKILSNVLQRKRRLLHFLTLKCRNLKALIQSGF